MARISRFVGLLMLGLAGVASAAMNPVAFKCTTKFVNNCEDSECAFTSNTIISVDCSIDQYSSADDVPETGTTNTTCENTSTYGGECSLSSFQSDAFTSWSGLVTALKGKLPSPQTYIENLKIKLGTDIVLDGAVCDQPTFDVSASFNAENVDRYVFDGGNHTIKGFCKTTDLGVASISFFGDLNYATVRDLTFKNAKIVNEAPVEAGMSAVVANTASNVVFYNVKVDSSTVKGWNAAGLVNEFEGNANADTLVLMHSRVEGFNAGGIATNVAKAEMDSVFLAQDTLNGLSGVKCSFNMCDIVLGGVAAVSNTGKILHVSSQNVLMGNEQQNVEDKSGNQKFVKRYMGGVIGVLSDDGTSSSEVSGRVTGAVLGGGTAVGGVIGKVALSPNLKIESVKVNATFGVDYASGLDDYYYNEASSFFSVNGVGGLIGETYVAVTLSGDSVAMTTDWEAASCTIPLNNATGSVNISRNVGGLVGFAVNNVLFVGNKVSVNHKMAFNSKLVCGEEGNKVTNYFNGDLSIGGLLGYQETVSEISYKDSANTVSMTVDAKTESSSITNLRVGGLLGFANSTSMGLESLKFLKDTVNVSIKVDGGALQNVYAGGEVGLIDNSYSSEILLKDCWVKSSIDVSAKAGSDFYLGGLVGSNFSRYVYEIRNNRVETNLLADVPGSLFMGGIGGNLNLYEGNVDIVNNQVSALDVDKPLIKSTAKKNKLFKVGGLAGYAYLNCAKFNSVVGDISVAATETTAGAGYVGGLLGYIEHYDGGDSPKAAVVNNYMVGNIDVEENVSADYSTHAGFVAGYYQHPDTETSDLILIRGNYHYGTSDSKVRYAVDSVYLDGSGTVSFSDWADGSKGLKNNYRNGVTGLSADGVLLADGSGKIDAESGGLLNGVVSNDDMKSRLFAYVMNDWMKDSDVHDSLKTPWESAENVPLVFADERTVYKLGFYFGKTKRFMTSDDRTLLGNRVVGDSLYVFTSTDKCGSGAIFYDPAGSFDCDASDYGYKLSAGTLDTLDGLTDAHYDFKVSKNNQPYSYDFTKDGFKADLSAELTFVGTVYVAYELSGYDDAVFNWLPVTQVKTEGTFNVVPYVVSGSTTLGLAYGVVAPYNCETRECIQKSMIYAPTSTDDAEKKYPFIEDIVHELVESGTWSENHSDTIHIVYMDRVIPRIAVTGEVGNEMDASITSFGYDQNGDAVKIGDPLDALSSMTSFSFGSVPMGSVEKISVARGYRLDSLGIFFGVGFKQNSGNMREQQLYYCMVDDSEHPCATDMVELVTLNDGEVYIASEEALKTKIAQALDKTYSDDAGGVVWRLSLQDADSLVLDTLLRAVFQQNKSADISTHYALRYIPFMTGEKYTVRFEPNLVTYEASAGAIEATEMTFTSSKLDTNGLFITDEYKTSVEGATGSASFPVDAMTHQEACFKGWYTAADYAKLYDADSLYTGVSPNLLNKVTVDDDSSFTLYGLWLPIGHSQCGHKESPIYLNGVMVSVDGVDVESEVHGNLVLSQNVQFPNGVEKVVDHTFEDNGGALQMIVPGENVSMTFALNSKVDAGYKLSQLNFECYDRREEKDCSEPLPYELETPETGDSSLKITLGDYRYTFRGKYDLLQYQISFTRPAANSNYFIAMGEALTGSNNWVDSDVYTVTSTKKFPVIYDESGCRIKWKPDVETYEGDGVVAVTADLLKYLSPVDGETTPVNKMVMSETPTCVREEVYTLTLETDGFGSVEMIQVIGSEDDTLVLRHKFKNVDGTLTMTVPKVTDETIKLTAVAIPQSGYVLKDISFDYKYGGVYDGTFVGVDSMELEVNSDQYWHVSFDNGGTYYLAYELGLTEEELAGLYVAEGSVTLYPGFKYTEIGNDLLKVYHSEKTLLGWSLIRPESRKSTDPLYSTFSRYVMQHSSIDKEEPTKLYAVWEDKAAGAAGQVVATLKDTVNTTVRACQELDSLSVCHEFVDGKLQVPAEMASVKLKLDAVADDGYTLESVYAKVGEVEAASDDNGFYVATSASPLLVYAKSKVKPDLTIVFDVSQDSVFCDTSWKDTLTFSFAGKKHVYLPKNVYRNNAVLKGWSLLTKAEAEGSVYDEITDEMRDAAVNGRDVVRDEDGVVFMKPVWKQETVATITLYNGAYEKGSMTLTHKNGVSYDVPAQGLIVPKTAEGLEFKISFKPGMGYIFDEDAGFATQAAIVGASEKLASNTVLAKASLYISPVNVGKGDYAVTYHTGGGKEVFYDDSWADTLLYKSYYVTDDTVLPAGLFRVGKCLDGWTLTESATAKVFARFDTALVKAYEDMAGEDADFLIDLYPSWADCDSQKLIVIDQSVDSMGSISLSSLASGKSYSLPLTVPSDGAVFKVTYVLNDGYSVKDNGVVYYMVGGNRVDLEDGILTATTAADLTIPAIKNVTITFVYDENAGDAVVFYGNKWNGQESFKLEEDAAFNMGLYREDYCLDGWAFSENQRKAYKEYDEEFRTDLEQVKKLSIYDGKLYAVWKSCQVGVSVVASASLDEGALTLRPLTMESIYSVDEKGLKVPESGLSFRMDFAVAEDYVWGEGARFVVTDAKGNVLEKAYDAKNDILTIVGDTLVVKANVVPYVDTTSRVYALNFDVNRKAGKVFYGSDWVTEMRYTLRGLKDTSSYELPKYVYTNGACVVGWSTQKDSSVGEDVFTHFDLGVAGKLSEKSANKLYAVWGKADQCVGYNRVKLYAENGTVVLQEIVAEGNGVVTINHEFAEDGSLLVPGMENGVFRIKALADSSYVMDSLVVNVNGRRVAYADSSLLSFSQANGEFTAYFSKANKNPIEFVELVPATSGNAVRLSFVTNDFEVTRGVSARVVVMNALSQVILEETLVDSMPVVPYSAFWQKLDFGAGSYVAVIELADKRDTVISEPVRFEVDDRIAAAGEDEWQMISMNAVDTASIKRDGDQVFFWWDDVGESGVYWQYREFVPGEEFDALRGFWYNSVKGRDLALNKKAKPILEDVTWKLDSAYSGWNMVANPYGWELDLYNDNRAAKKDNLDECEEFCFWRYDNTIDNYVRTSVLKPYEAAWVHIGTATASWHVKAEPLYGVAQVAEKRSALAKADSKSSWSIQAVLSDNNGKQDVWNVMGVGERAVQTAEPPTSMGDHVDLSIVEGKRALAKSVKTEADSYEWELSLSASSDRVGKLSLVGVSQLKSLGYRAYVVVNGKSVEVNEGDEIPVALKASASKASVRVTKGSVNVQLAAVENLHMVQNVGALNVNFDVDESLAGSRLVVDVLNMDGKVMASYSGRAVAGSNAVSLDAPRTGLYMLRVRVANQQATGKVMVK